MHLLITNDDGIHAAGLRALADALDGLGTLWFVAPSQERSATSHAFTMHRPLRVEPRGERRWAVDGSPADCVYLAVNHLLPQRPDVVVAGINHGSNLGDDVFYSGTVAAAAEACLLGLPAVAISLDRPDGAPASSWSTARLAARRVVQGVLDHGVPEQTFLNVNVPPVPPEALRGIRTVRHGRRHYQRNVEVRTDPFGRTYYWIGGPHRGFEPIDESDGPTLEQGWCTVLPMGLDRTQAAALPAVRAWTDA